MNLLLPAFFGAAAAIGVPLALHLLRRQARAPVPFPTLRFLGIEAQRDSRRHRLNRWLLLLLRCLAILLVVLAFARPFWRLPHSSSSKAVVVIVDNSYSMDASDRRVAVQRWLAPQLAGLKPPDQLGVLLLQPHPAWVVPLGDDLDAGRAAVATLPAAFETTHNRPAVEVAAARLALAPARTKIVLVAGDGQKLGWNDMPFDRPVAHGIEIRVAPPAAAVGRQGALTSLRVERLPQHRLAFDAVLQAYAPASDRRTVSFFAGDTKLGSVESGVTAGRTTAVHFETTFADADAALALRATLDPDDLPTDDTGYAALAAADNRQVLVAPDDAAGTTDFLARALEAVHPGAGLPAFDLQPLPANGPWPLTAVAVLRGRSPFRDRGGAPLDAFVAGGGAAWLVCDGSAEQAAWLAKRGVHVREIEAPPGEPGLGLRDFALDHPLFAPFVGQSLAPLFEPAFSRGWALEGDDLEPLARWPDGSVAIAELPTDRGRVLLTGFGVSRDDSDFPIRAGFVPLVHRAVSWLAEKVPAAPSVLVGMPIGLPGSGTWRSLVAARLVPTANVAGSVTPTVPGVYAFASGNTRQLYAVNLDHSESDLEPWPVPSDFARLSAAAEPDVKAPTGDASARPLAPVDDRLVDERHAWWWLLAAAVVLLVFENRLANRTVL